MVYRLTYDDATRLGTYRDSRWVAAPAALLQERLRQRLTRATGSPSPASLHVELEEFCHVFDTPSRSRAVIRLRAVMVESASGRVLRRQVFAEEAIADAADAAAGAHALVRASDAALARVVAWAAGVG